MILLHTLVSHSAKVDRNTVGVCECRLRHTANNGYNFSPENFYKCVRTGDMKVSQTSENPLPFSLNQAMKSSMFLSGLSWFFRIIFLKKCSKHET